MFAQFGILISAKLVLLVLIPVFHKSKILMNPKMDTNCYNDGNCVN